MATAVLRSQDCLKGLYHLEAFGTRPPPPAKSHRRKPSRPSPPASYPSSSPPKPRQRQLLRSPLPPPPPPSLEKPLGGAAASQQRPRRKSRSPAKEVAPDKAKRVLVIEEVRILKRGEVLEPALEDLRPDACDLTLCSTNRIGPEPEILPKKLGFAGLGSIYAGPAFFASPSPSSLPIPGFLKGDEATKSLRRALGIAPLP